MAGVYVTDEVLKIFAVGQEADTTVVWELLAEGVSRLFDRECNVADGFFLEAGNSVSLKSYRADGTRYLELLPYISNSITIIDVDGTDYFETIVADRLYHEKDGFLVFDTAIKDGTLVNVTAKYGFASIPPDIQLACAEMALAMWRRKDMSFADISGVSAAAVNAELSPSFAAVTRSYRDIYSPNQYFS